MPDTRALQLPHLAPASLEMCTPVCQLPTMALFVMMLPAFQIRQSRLAYSSAGAPEGPGALCVGVWKEIRFSLG